MDHTNQLAVSRVTLPELLGSPDTYFRIPHYQRKYAWDETRCESFLEDVLKVATRQQRTHFFSNVTLSPLDEPEPGQRRYYVVDGQQRVTTASLFLKALADTLAESRRAEAERLNACLQEGELARLSFEDHVDQRTYRHLLLGHFCEPESLSENMVGNYRFFAKKLKEHEDAIGQGLADRFLDRLLFVCVILPPTMPPQRIFERMNAAKEPVRQLDLIKNYLLIQAGGPEDESALYDTLEEHLKEWEWPLWLIASAHAGRAISYEEIYQRFKQFYASRYGAASPAAEFVPELREWIAGFTDVIAAVDTLNGNDGLRHGQLGRYAPLMMKIAMTLPGDSNAQRREALLARIVKHLRAFIATERLWTDRFHPARWDAEACNRCLKESGLDSSPAALEAVIATVFPEYSNANVDEAIRNWVENATQKLPGNASRIGIYEIARRNGATAEDVVAHFHGTFEENRRTRLAALQPRE